MPSPSQSFSAIAPLPPAVVSIGNGVFEIPTDLGTPYSFTVPTDYNLYVGTITPDSALGTTGDWYEFCSGAAVVIYQKTSPTAWTVRTTINSAPGNIVTNSGVSVNGNLASFSGLTGKVISDSGIAASSVGDVSGPASAVSANFAAFDGVTGKLISDSGSSAESLQHVQSAITLSPFSVTSSDVLVDVTGLSLNVVAGSNYIIEAVAIVSSDPTGGGQFSISGTAHWSPIWFAGQCSSALSPGDLSVINIKGEPVAFDDGLAGSTRATITGGGHVSVSGTITLQFAQATPSPSTSQLIPCASLKITRV